MKPSDERASDAGRRALVTGGAGFIGSHLVRGLLKQEWQVAVLDDFSTGSEANLHEVADSIDLHRADIRDLEACRQACRGVEVIFHQAALGSVPRSVADPATSISVNVTGTATLFAAARDEGVARVVYASSSSVYGDDPTLPKKEGIEGRPLSPYALSKAMTEQIANLFDAQFGITSVGLRYFNVFGPRQDPKGPYAAVIPRFFEAYATSQAPVVFGDGEQSRDFTFVDNVVDANLLAAAAPSSAGGRAFNVGAGQSTSINEIARRVRELVGGGPEPEHRPPRPGDVRHSLADLTQVEAAIGYVPKVSVAEGLKRATAYYLGQERELVR